MAVGVAGFDTKAVEAPRTRRFHLEGLGSRDGLAFVCKDGAGVERRDVGHMVGMRVGEEEQAQVEAVRGDEVEHRLRCRTGVEGDGVLRLWVPDEVGVHGHVAPRRVELREAIEGYIRGKPGIVGHRDQRRCVQLQRSGECGQRSVVHLAVLGSTQGFDAHSGLGGEHFIGKAEAALGFGDHIIEKVFEG